MNYYLSSYKFGNQLEKLRTMLPQGSKIGHINNSKDFSHADPIKKALHQNEEIAQLNDIGFLAEPLDLKAYFGKEALLQAKLAALDGLWVSGGNTFILRQAMKLSGFDNIFKALRNRKNFLYAGYSAGICVLCDSLKYIKNVDDPDDFPYPESKEVIWNGLSVFDYALLPHYDSDHFESEAMGKELQICIDNKWLFKALRDGDVIIMEED